ncbi:MAG: DNA repair protein [Clostridia bacterium]|nr:DNA repair protein [Clostridia bacterium]MBQ5812980.1 DNA repair protein [Clostridia bacterium]
MTDKELRKLTRAELLEMLISQMKENERLQEQVEELAAQLEDRRIMLEEAGSIAEASLRLNGVFQAAEKAAQQYLDNIKRLSDEKPRKEVKK